MIPDDPELAWQTRLKDRLFDAYVHESMQKIVANKLRPADAKDPTGVAQARSMLQLAYGMIESDLAGKTWAMDKSFSIADCAASPALYYANLVEPLGEAHRNTSAYLERLKQRPSFARVIEAAQPYFKFFPGG